MDSVDCNVSKTLLFLKEVLKLADLWPNTRWVLGSGTIYGPLPGKLLNKK